uniref:Uncharacterized protein ycf20 n=1 Tax=Flintiella sanguinaria TaxID=101926 RepID=A0A1X9PU67_9RHOD|nr:conserved hypothetical plastid protein [Flintiella sanguinaria]
MKSTKLSGFYKKLIKIVSHFNNKSIAHFSINLISLLGGFFIANALATLPSQTGDWSVVVSGVLVAITELTSKIVYKFYETKNKNLFIITWINNMKIGIIYGFFVDSFKLGS